MVLETIRIDWVLSNRYQTYIISEKYLKKEISMSSNFN